MNKQLFNNLSDPRISITRKKKLLRTAPSTFVKLLANIALNIIVGNLTVTKYKKKKLRPFVKKIERLAKSGETVTRKRTYIANQTGGFLHILLPLAASIAGTLAGTLTR